MAFQDFRRVLGKGVDPEIFFGLGRQVNERRYWKPDFFRLDLGMKTFDDSGIHHFVHPFRHSRGRQPDPPTDLTVARSGVSLKLPKNFLIERVGRALKFNVQGFKFL